MRGDYKVMHVTDTLGMGGKERLLVDLANASFKLGMRPSVCVTRRDTSLSQDLRKEIPCFALERKSRFDFKKMREFSRKVREEKIDLLHAHGRSTFSFLMACRMLGWTDRPVLFHDHCGEAEIREGVPLWMKLFGKNHVGFYAGVYSRLEGWAREAGIPSSKIRTVSNAIDLDRLQNAPALNLKQMLGLSEKVKIGIGVGRIEKAKGWEILFHALKLSRAAADCHIALAGPCYDPAYQKRLEELLRSLGLESRVHFLGKRKDAPGLMKSADFAVMPSLSESGPLVLAEFLYNGLPVVSAKTGDISIRMAEAGIPGFVPVGDEKAFAKGLDDLMAEPGPALQARKEKGQEFVVKNFSMEKRVLEWLEIYRKLV